MWTISIKSLTEFDAIWVQLFICLTMTIILESADLEIYEIDFWFQLY